MLIPNFVLMIRPNFTDPKAIAELGEKIYDELYREKYEKDHLGEFVVIEVGWEQAYLGNTPDAAYDEAHKEISTGGLFHLIKVGSPGAFHT